jgi:outer membrane protein OmpA-like peptidoglycan-associated protein
MNLFKRGNMKIATMFVTAVLMLCACSVRKGELLMEEERRAGLEMQSVQDMVTSRAIPPVEFETGSAVLLPSSFNLLDRVAEIFLRHPKLKLIVEGHTDDVGGDARNEELSLQRAGSVKLYLATKGIHPDSVRVYGYSHSRRVTTDTSPRGRALNRRVEFIFTNRHWESVF